MKGSVIKRMYAGFALIIIMFAVTITIMMNSMNQIHSNFESVSETSLPLVALSNQTSVQLLSADKSFKDFLTTQNVERMAVMRSTFVESQDAFSEVLGSLEAASEDNITLVERVNQLRAMEDRYFTEAAEAMTNYVTMLSLIHI